MAKAIAFSLFGYDRDRAENCFDFQVYLRGLQYNIRIARVLYPNWDIVVNMDHATYASKYQKYFDWLQNRGFIKIVLHQDNQPLTLAMLWRMHTVFTYTHPEWVYTHVICRDIDSVPTYREAQAVQQWIEEGKACHGITDSISHNIPMMGGMIGFAPGAFSSIMGVNKYEDLMRLGNGKGYDFKIKNTDQRFIQDIIYPKVCRDITEHFVLGMRHDLPESDGRHYSIPDIEVPGVGAEWKCTNDLAGHIGAAGCYEPPTIKFLNHLDPYKDEYAEIEKCYPQLFFWRG